jgi:uncharacterized membrane protein YjjP (DUF1212 family)
MENVTLDETSVEINNKEAEQLNFEQLNIDEKAHFDRVISIALDLSAGLLQCGASVNRVEFACKKICLAFGAKEVNVFAFPSILEVSVKVADGSERSQMKRIYYTFNNFHKLEVLNQLSRDICDGKYTIETARAKLDEVLAKKYYRLPIAVLGGGIATGIFTVFYGGTLIEAIPSLLTGCLMTYLSFILMERDFNSYARTFVLSVIGGFLSIFLSWLLRLMGAECNSSVVMIGTIMVVIPGLLICNALRDMLAGDLFSGSFELLNGIITTLAIAAGYGIAMFLLKDINTVEEVVPRTGWLYYIYIIPACIVGSASFSIMFNYSYKRLPVVALNIAISFAVWLLMERYVADVFIDTLVSTMVAATIAEIMARLDKAPSNIFMIPAILPFVPGAPLYYAVSYAVNGDYQLAAEKGTIALATFIGIAVGLSAITAISQIINPMNKYFHSMNKKFKNDKTKK